MPKTPESTSAANNSNGSTSFDKLTKSQLIELLRGSITRPLTPESLHRAAFSIVEKWCEDVVCGRFASLYEVQCKLTALEKIYLKK